MKFNQFLSNNKQNIKKYLYFAAIYPYLLPLFIFILIGLSACKNTEQTDSHSHEEEQHTESAHQHEAESNGIVTLTAEQIQAVGIETGNIERKELTATIKVNGMLRVPNSHKGNATSLYGGVIKSIHAQIGDYVRKGQVIATISNPQFIQLQEEYLTLGSKITFAEQEVNRQNELNTGNAGALKNLQSATAELNALRTRRASLQQQIQLMGINPRSVSNSTLKTSLVVTSPIAGVVSNVFPKIGSYVDVSSPVAEIVDNSSLHLDLHVFEKDLPLLKVGQIIHFTITNNPTNEYDARVFSIGSSFENDSKTISVHCAVTGNKAGLIDGMNITGVVSLSDVTAPAVPDAAIVSNEGKDYLFIVTDRKGESHSHEDEHSHETGEKQVAEEKHVAEENKNSVSFERVEVVKGVSHMGYTAVTLVSDVPPHARIATKGAFFINAKMTNTGDHAH